MNPHGHALGKPDPGKDRIDIGNPQRIGLRIRNIDRARKTIDMPLDFIREPHQPNACRVSILDRADGGFLEIALHPKGVGIDQRQCPISDNAVVA